MLVFKYFVSLQWMYATDNNFEVRGNNLLSQQILKPLFHGLCLWGFLDNRYYKRKRRKLQNAFLFLSLIEISIFILLLFKMKQDNQMVLQFLFATWILLNSWAIAKSIPKANPACEDITYMNKTKFADLSQKMPLHT